jgi:hypothetical protein
VTFIRIRRENQKVDKFPLDEPKAPKREKKGGTPASALGERKVGGKGGAGRVKERGGGGDE